MIRGPVNIFVANHYENGIGIQDFVDLIRFELDDIGVESVVSTNILTDCINIIFEEFRNPHFRKVLLDQFVPDDPRLVVVATEVVRDGIFNSMGSIDRTLQAGHYTAGSELWVERTDGFKEVAHLFSTVLCPAEQIFSSFSNQFSDLCNEIVYWPLRYKHQMLQRKRTWPSCEAKQSDFSFSGSVTPYREAVLKHLATSGYKVDIKVGHTSEFLRYASACQSHFMLAVKHYPSTDLLSKMRVWWALSNHLPIFVESYSEITDLDEFLMIYRDADDLINQASSHTVERSESLIQKYKDWSEGIENPFYFLERYRVGTQKVANGLR
jgi:hypothetical protein